MQIFTSWVVPALLGIFCLPAFAGVAPAFSTRDLVLADTDSDFGGYYLDIERTVERLQVSRLQAHEIQKLMRDELELLSGSPSVLEQAPYLSQALANSVDAVVSRGVSPSGYRPMRFRQGEFVIVFDLDETLLTHWYRHGKGVGINRKGSLSLAVRDVVPSFVDRATGDSLDQPKLTISGSMVQLRPGIGQMAKRLAAIPGFRGFVLFTAKEDRSAEALISEWRKQDASFFRHVKGVFARNHLRIGQGLKKPSKDLRIFDETLQHALLLDDNESRVMQQELCFAIPKFNADAYLDALGPDKPASAAAVLAANTGILPYAAAAVAACAKASRGGDGAASIARCWADGLGNAAGTPDAELKAYEAHLKRRGVRLDGIDLHSVFHQPFEFEFTRPLQGVFPKFKGSKRVSEVPVGG
ncbi:MAG: hypothetical protein IT285_14860 [Bdellovibrionales bacterium]|nr:hypothetical protein [Bdellovibrionales bacterium]